MLRAVAAGAVGRLAGLNSGYAANLYYGAEGYAVGSTPAAAMVANTLYGTPFVCRYPTTFTRIGIDVTTGAAGLARLGIYQVTGGLPAALVLDAGTVDTTSIATVEATISQFLPMGVYVLAAIFNATPTVRVNNGNGALLIPHTGGSTPTGGSIAALSRSVAFGALPATFGAVTYIATGNVPGEWLRVV